MESSQAVSHAQQREESATQCLGISMQMLSGWIYLHIISQIVYLWGQAGPWCQLL